jgi:hypothetical protein
MPVQISNADYAALVTERDALKIAMSEIAACLDGLGEAATPETIENDYLVRARYFAEVASGKREPIPGAPQVI